LPLTTTLVFYQQGFPAKNGKNGLRAINNTLFHMTRTEIRQDDLINDLAGGCIGQHRLQPISNLNTDLTFLGSDDQQDAVIFALLPDMPVSSQLVAIVIDAVAIQGGDSRHHHLIGSAVLIGLK